MSVPEGFTSMMFFTDVACDDDPTVMLIPLFENLDFPSLTEKLLTLLAPSILLQAKDKK